MYSTPWLKKRPTLGLL